MKTAPQLFGVGGDHQFPLRSYQLNLPSLSSSEGGRYFDCKAWDCSFEDWDSVLLFQTSDIEQGLYSQDSSCPFFPQPD